LYLKINIIKMNETNVILIGAGIMSATLGTLLKQLNPDIKIQICNWIEEEIEFLNKKRNLEESNREIIKSIDSKNKILIGLSVAQISYFINILMQVGIIKHANHRDVFRMISENFKTSNTDNISIDSLSSKFYNVETTTKTSIKEKIIELLNISKK